MKFLQLNTLFWVLLLPVAAQAQAKNSVAEVLCTVGGWLWGPLGSIIGVLGVIVLGITAMFGRIQIGTVLTTLAGIALIFGAQSVVNALGLNASCAATTTAVNIIGSPIYHMFACMVKWFDGPIGKSLASIAIITLGVFAIYGRISYHQALVVSAGIATMFGAVSIVGNLGMQIKSGGGVGNFPLFMACATSSSIENVYCNLVSWFNGPLGKTIGTLGIIIVGLGALYGKVSWGIAIIAGVGAAMIFGGTTIVSALGGPGDMACATGIAAGSVLPPISIAVAYCNVISWLNGPIGKGVATLSIIILGLGSLFGKISWTMAIVVGVGVALIFGGTTMLSALGGPGDLPCEQGFMDGNAKVFPNPMAPLPTLPTLPTGPIVSQNPTTVPVPSGGVLTVPPPGTTTPTTPPTIPGTLPPKPIPPVVPTNPGPPALPPGSTIPSG